MGAPAQQQPQPAQACSTNSQQYAQQQQQYNQQLQQYNYQLQQYNYQQQQNQYYGYSSYATPPVPPTPCSNGAGQCQSLAARPDPSTCPTGTWRVMTSAQGTGSVCPVWQCVAGNTPTAQLTCNPAVAENGTPVTITYSCTNSQSSRGHGFTTAGALSGATTTVINAPANASAANFALQCQNAEASSAAQCTVQIAKMSIMLRAAPATAPIGGTTLIGWVTSGMESCIVSSPDQPDFTARNSGNARTSGIATSSPLTGPTDFYLNCTSLTGQEREEKITVGQPGTVFTSIDTRTNVQRGTRATITWNFPSAPDVSAVALWLFSVEDDQTVALISGHRAKAGTYAWDIPNEYDPCNSSSSLVCGTDLIPGRTYKVLATLYTPVNAQLGEFNDSSLPEPLYLDTPLSAQFKFRE